MPSYRVLLAVEDPAVAAELSRRLPSLGYEAAGTVAPAEALRAKELGADVVLVGAASGEERRRLAEQVRVALPVAEAVPEGELQSRDDGSGACVAIPVSDRGLELALFAARERFAASRELGRLRLVHGVLERVDKAVVSATTREELFRRVCAAACEGGVFQLAWIGWVEPDGRVSVAAAEGPAAEYARRISVSADSKTPTGQGLSGIAIREGRPGVANDFMADARTRPWQAIAAGYAIRSSATFPLRVGGKLVGIFHLYAPEVGFFGAEEVRLLESVTENTSFGLEKIEQEERRARAEARYHQYIDASPLAILVLDREGRLQEVNRATCELTGHAAGQLLGRRLAELAGPAGPPLSPAALEALRREGSLRVDTELLRADGTAVPVACSAVPLPEGRALAFFSDLSERARTEGELRKLWRAVEQSPAAILITDANGAIEYTNPSFSRVTGYGSAEVLGRNPRLLKSGRTPLETYKEMWSRITAGHEWHGELHNRRKDGTLFWESVSIAPVADASGRITHFLAIAEDVTARKGLEQQLRQAQKMEAVGRLAGGVAHDFNNLLTVILSGTAFLRDSFDPQDPRLEDVEEVHKAGERGAALTRQLLAFSRKQIVSPQLIELNAIVGNLDKMVRRLIGEDVELTARIGSEPAQVFADPGQIEQVVLNLAVNARDAMPEGGKLTLATLVDRSGPVPTAVIEVRDSGQGMDEATRSRLFEPFFTTKAHGTGLGLATVYGIVKQAGGDVDVESAPGQGACFRVRLPLSAAQPKADLAPPVELAPRARGTVLVVEDEVRVRSIVCRALAGNGYTVLEADSGESALRIAREHAGVIDLLLTDVVMPQMGGRALSEQIDALRPGTRVLFMSGYTDDAVLQRGLAAAKVSLLHKPFTPDLLLARVREALA